MRIQLLADVCAALIFLHGRQPPIVHGDLKDTNIFVERCASPGKGRYRAKLLDFGLSMMLTKRAQMRGGTVRWMDPELVRNPGQAPSTAADVFSFGIVAFFAVTGSRPHSQLASPDLLELVKSSKEPPLNWSEAEAPALGPSHRPLVERCLEGNSACRPSMIQVKAALLMAARQAKGSDAHLPLEEPAANMHELLQQAREAFATSAGAPSQPKVSARSLNPDDLQRNAPEVPCTTVAVLVDARSRKMQSEEITEQPAILDVSDGFDPFALADKFEKKRQQARAANKRREPIDPPVASV